MENQNINQEQNQPQGWKDVRLTVDMPVAALVHFLNILNQRLASVEDNLLVELPDGKRVSITEVYRIQAEEERKAQEQNQQKGE